MLTPKLTLEDSEIPRFFYGTAWKEEQTEALTFMALKTGFTAIDTANQRKHYNEVGVGQAVRKFLSSAVASRSDLFIQSKYTFARGQDHRKPYNEKDSYTKQVQDSLQSTLEHFNSSYLDSFVLHGPYSAGGITEEDLEVWTAMESLYAQKKVRFLGVSNVDANQLTELYSQVNVKPSFVQNRCYAELGWDKEVRIICNEAKMIYQGFSLLTANRFLNNRPSMLDLSKKYQKSVAQIIFRFSQQIGMITLTGTSSQEHMKQDLNIYDFELSSAEISAIESIAT